MTIEQQRARIVRNLVLASLAQDTCLLLANTASGVGNLFGSLSTSFGNYAHTCGFLFNDQQAKYEALTGRSFARQAIAVADEDDE